MKTLLISLALITVISAVGFRFKQEELQCVRDAEAEKAAELPNCPKWITELDFANLDDVSRKLKLF